MAQASLERVVLVTKSRQPATTVKQRSAKTQKERPIAQARARLPEGAGAGGLHRE